MAHLPIENPLEMVSLPCEDVVSDLLRCSMCKKFPVVPLRVIGRCQGGHLSCVTCAKVQENRGCTKPIAANVICGQKVVIDQDLANVLSYLYTKSRYICPKKGCEEIIFGQHLPRHSSFCGFGITVACPETNCPEPKHGKSVKEYNVVELWDHFEAVHPTAMLPSQDTRLQLGSSALLTRPKNAPYVFAAFQAFDEKFAVVAEETDKTFVFVGYILNNNVEIAAKFKLLLKVHGKTPDQSFKTWHIFEFSRNLSQESRKDLIQENLIISVHKRDLSVACGMEDEIAYKHTNEFNPISLSVIRNSQVD